jgi:Peptidase family M1 domain
MRIYIQILFCCTFLGSVAAQDLFMPRNLAKAYTAETRDKSGKPGPKYWQNRAEYEIHAVLNTKMRKLTGSETIKYHNNSPDTLKSIVIKINADLYKRGAQRANDLTPTDILVDGVLLKRILVNGYVVPDSMQSRNGTILNLKMKKPVAPGATTELEIDWAFTFPKGEDAPRICMCDPSTYFVAYWYPQVAVYDDIHGWNNTPYNGMQEFYNDFNDYDVYIQTPKGNMVWATGELENAKDVLQKEYYQRYKRAHETDSIVQIWTESDMKRKSVLKGGANHIFHYQAKSVPDFAFATSGHYNWDATQVTLPGRTDVNTFVSAVYKTESTDYKSVARIASDGIKLMSSWLPGYPFPYPSMTVFNGNDGMEYPMMCNDASTAPEPATGLTVHEISHTYFPFMMGVNEQMYAWMDEGWASFFDYMLTDSLDAKHGGKANTRNYDVAAGNEWDVPPMVQSRFLSSPAYRTASYVRAQAAYLTLYDMLGEKKFQECMKYYMDTWKGKHPMPYDFFNSWNQASGQNLDWFWKAWFFEWGYPDLTVSTVNNDAKSPTILIKRIGNIPTGVHAAVTYSDGSSEVIRRGADVWATGVQEVTLTGAAGKQIKAVTLGLKTIPDVNRVDNGWGLK